MAADGTAGECSQEFFLDGVSTEAARNGFIVTGVSGMSSRKQVFGQNLLTVALSRHTGVTQQNTERRCEL